jgi:uncharacterized protein (DUF169 family)
MDLRLKRDFQEKWAKYFNHADLPITFYYTDSDTAVQKHNPSSPRSCFICDLVKVRNGADLYFDQESVTCTGGKRYLGYSDKLRTGFEYFLSGGNETIEGERYIKSPEIVKQWLKDATHLPLHDKKIVFKRWDKLTEEDTPEVVIFFAKPDVLAGLFTLYNFCQDKPGNIIAPFGSGCSTIVEYPLLNKDKAIIGMMDPSARVCLPKDTHTFSFAFESMQFFCDAIDQSFLITDSWKKIQKRIE